MRIAISILLTLTAWGIGHTQAINVTKNSIVETHQGVTDLYKFCDTINSQTNVTNPNNRFPVLEFAIPVTLFTASALTIDSSWGENFRKDTQQALSNGGENHTSIDDYLQFVPALAPYALDLCGYKSKHSLIDKTILLGISSATFLIFNFSMESAFHEQRPDGDGYKSFPSSHTGIAFMGAEFMRREYWDQNKWIAMSGYLLATTTGYLRIYNNRHWINDVIGGAALGYLSTTLAYWLYPKIFPSRSCAKPSVFASPFAAPSGAGLSLSCTF